MIGVLAALNAAAWLGPGCARTTREPVAPRADQAAPFFEDMTAASGVDFTYRNGEEADHFTILESLGGGAAMLDYDGDGLLDIFLPGGGYFAGPDRREIRGHRWKLYRNLGHWRFQDVTREAGLEGGYFYTHGVAVADYDCDGWPDFLVTGWGRLALFHNEAAPGGGRRFVEVAERAGLTSKSWSSSAGWADCDGDGFPDLYVCHYADWSWAAGHNPSCRHDDAIRDVCTPKSFSALPHVLYHNNGDGTFRDISKPAGLRVPRAEAEFQQLQELDELTRQRLRRADQLHEYGKGLGVLLADINGDGRPDIYVANDTVDNFLYLNRSQNGRTLFEECGFSAGVAVDDRGMPNGSMGVDAGDCDGSGRPSLLVTNYEHETHALYRNACQAEHVFFRHFTQASGLASLGLAYVGWGTRFVDLDLDGAEDLFIVHGHAMRFPSGAAARAQRPVLMRNLGNSRFQEITAQGGPYFQTVHRGRGAAFGDLDNDGRVDAVISHLNEPVVLLRNQGGANQHWLGIEIVGHNHRDVVGARIILEAGGCSQTRFVKGGGSYASAHDSRHVFGMGSAHRIDRLTVVWPNGKKQTWQDLDADRYWRLREEAPNPGPDPVR